MVRQSRSAPSDEQRSMAILSHLVTAADGDTLYRDVYLRRASEILSPIVSEPQYEAIVANRAEVERLRAQVRVAVARQEWERVRELGTRAAALQQSVQRAPGTLAVAENVYGAPAVVPDPLSPGLLAFCRRWSQAAQARDEACAALAHLGREDVDKQSFYAARRAALGALDLPGRATVGAEGDATSSAVLRSVADLEHLLLEAIERGDVARLEQLTASMSGKQQAADFEPADGHTASKRHHIAVPGSLGEPIPDSAVSRAAALGLEHVEAPAVEPSLASAVSDFLELYAIRASAAVFERASDGIAQLTLATEGVGLAHDAAETFAGNFALLALHLTVNSAGLRYLPLATPREPVLIESHPEGDERVTPLLRELGLDRRRALARDDVETALLTHGARVLVDHLGLDPLAFRLVCVPAELYVRIGRERGWGMREEWTHFDGYQVLRSGRLRALVGGNARFGLFDVCSISRDDARENTLVRLAVVRRDRFAVRFA
jgi:hypothetical protein